MGSRKWGLENYSLSSKDDHPRRFQYTWFSLYPSWLEYSPLKDDAYCLSFYFFSKKPSAQPSLDIFIVRSN